MMTRNLLPALPAALLVPLIAIGVQPLWLTVPLGLVAALIAPGVALLALFARRELRGFPGVALVAAASLGTLVLGGLILNLLPWGLTPLSWAIGLLVITLATSALAARSGFALFGGSLPTARMSPATIVKVAVCVVLAGVTVGVAVTSQQAADRAQPLTELWLTDVDHDSDVTVNLRNGEGGSRDYRVSVQVNDQDIVSQDVTVADGSTWSEPVPLVRTGTDRDDLVVSVYAGSDTVLYRQVTLNSGAATP